MLSPSKIYSKLLEIHQESLTTQNELRRMKNEIEKFTFCQQLNSITMSEYESPNPPKTSSGGSNRNVSTNLLNDTSAPISSFPIPERLMTSFESNNYNKTPRTLNQSDPLFTPVSQYFPPSSLSINSDTRLVSPKTQIYEFENEVNRRIQSFKKQFEENLKEFTQSSPWRDRSTKTSSQIGPSSPPNFFQSDKADFSNQVDYTAKFESPPPKSSKDSDMKNLSMKNILSDLRPEPSPLFHFNRFANTGSDTRSPSSKSQNSKMTTPNKASKSNFGLEESVHNAQRSFKEDLEEIRSRSGIMNSYQATEEKVMPSKGQSPFFSPLKASDLMIQKDPNEIVKSIDSQVYKNFIKPMATPLVGDFMSSNNGLRRYNDLSSAHTSPPHYFRKTPDIYDVTSNNKMNNSGGTLGEDLKEASLNLNDKFDDSKSDHIDMKERQASLQIVTETERPSANYSNNVSHNSVETPKNQESPDLDRIRIKPSRETNESQDRIIDTNPSGGKWYKLVAIKEGKLVSVIDGRTEYIIGKPLVKHIEQKDQKFDGGIYVYNSINAALQAKFPKNARMLSAPKAIVRVSVHGSYLNCTSVYSAITPIEYIYVG